MSALSLPVLEVHQAFTVRSLPGGGASVVIDVVNTTSRVASNLPARRQRARFFPVSRLGVVIDVIASTVRIGSSFPSSRKRLVIAIADHFAVRNCLPDRSGLRRLQWIWICWCKALVIWWRLVWRRRLIPVHSTRSSHSSSWSRRTLNIGDDAIRSHCVRWWSRCDSVGGRSRRNDCVVNSQPHPRSYAVIEYGASNWVSILNGFRIAGSVLHSHWRHVNLQAV